jgi:phage shock protein B
MDTGMIHALTGLLAVLLIFGPVFVAGLVWALRALKGNAAPRSKALQAEETKLIQEIYQGLSRMEERVEALETLLLERERKGGEK